MKKISKELNEETIEAIYSLARAAAANIPNFEDREDAVQDGVMAALVAIERADDRKKISGFVGAYIYGAVKKYINRGLPADALEHGVKTFSSIEDENKDTPSISMFSPVNVSDVLDTVSVQDEHKRAWEHVERDLTPRQAELIHLRYGEGLTVKEAADKMKVTTSRVSQMEKTSLEKLAVVMS